MQTTRVSETLVFNFTLTLWSPERILYIAFFRHESFESHMVPCGLTYPQVTGGGDVFQIRRIVVNALNTLLRDVGEGWSSSGELHGELYLIPAKRKGGQIKFSSPPTPFEASGRNVTVCPENICCYLVKWIVYRSVHTAGFKFYSLTNIPRHVSITLWSSSGGDCICQNSFVCKILHRY
jgi:hypothetical protein